MEFYERLYISDDSTPLKKNHKEKSEGGTSPRRTLPPPLVVPRVLRDVLCDSDRMFGKTKRVLKSVKM